MSSALAVLLEDEPGFAVSQSRAQGTAQIARVCQEVRPRVVVVDIGDRAPLIGAIVGGSRGADSRAVVAVVSSDSGDAIAQAFVDGAHGVVTRDADPSELIRAVREVSAGYLFASRTALRLLLERLATPRVSLTREPLRDHERLSGRERDAVDWLAQGMTNQEIARAMFVSEATVKAHLSRVMSKWGARDRVQLVIRALGAGFAQPDDRRAIG